jgi:hypothetical protein
MKKNAYAYTTIKATGKRLKHIERNCNLDKPEQVKGFIATKQRSNAYKESLTEAYNHYCNANGIIWNKPFYRIRQTTQNPNNRKPNHAHSKRKTKNGTIPFNVQRLRNKTNRTNMAKNQRYKPKKWNSNYNKRKTLQRQNTKAKKQNPRNAQTTHPKAQL